MQIIGLDLAKRVFQVHALDASGEVFVRTVQRACPHRRTACRLDSKPPRPLWHAEICLIELGDLNLPVSVFDGDQSRCRLRMAGRCQSEMRIILAIHDAFAVPKS